MVNASKRRGTNAETAIVEYLRAHGAPHAERRALTGNKDRGDIAGVIGVMIEAKDHRRDGLPGFMDEVDVQKINDRADIGVCWHKRRGTTDPGRWMVTMTGEQFIEILHLTGHLPREHA
jgi:hypothetical protein